MVTEKSEFRSDLVGALMVEGYDLLFAHYVVDVLRSGAIDPFGEGFPRVRNALESLGVFDNPTLQARIEG